MEFLVQIVVELPGEMGAEERAELSSEELARGRELIASGAIKSIWRIPGRPENVGIWAAADATELHGLLESLPLFPWISATVTALARHPLGED